MSLLADAAASTPTHSAAGTLVPAAILVGALAASTAVVLLHASSLGALRDRLDELGQARGPAPADRSRSNGPMFGALYSTAPTLLDRIRAAPLPVVTAVAVLLATLSGLLLLRGVGEARDLALSQGAVIGQMRAAHDSLSTVVTALRDSLRAAHTTPSTPAGAPDAPATPARSRPARIARAPRPSPSRAELPPAPSLEAPTTSSR